MYTYLESNACRTYGFTFSHRTIILLDCWSHFFLTRHKKCTTAVNKYKTRIAKHYGRHFAFSQDVTGRRIRATRAGRTASTPRQSGSFLSLISSDPKFSPAVPPIEHSPYFSKTRSSTVCTFLTTPTERNKNSHCVRLCFLIFRSVYDRATPPCFGLHIVGTIIIYIYNDYNSYYYIIYLRSSQPVSSLFHYLRLDYRQRVIHNIVDYKY